MAGGIIGGLAASVLPGVLGSVLPTVMDVLKRIIPDPVEQAKIQNELTEKLLDQEKQIQQAIAEAAKAQNEVNLAEAQNPSIFVSGWRPAVGWVCVMGCVYCFFLQPVIGYLSVVLGAAAGANIPYPPNLDSATLMGLLTGILGLGTLRTVDKMNGVAAPETGSPAKVAAIRKRI